MFKDNYTLHLELEQLTNKYQLLPFLRSEVKEIAEDTKYSHIDKNILINALSYMLLYKRAEPGMLVGLLYPKFRNKDLIINELEKMVKAHLIIWDEEGDELITAFNLDPESQERLDKFQYPLPFLVPPKELKKNSDTGFYTSTGSVILKNNFTNDDVNIDHINTINKIEYKINEDVLNHLQNKWNAEPMTQSQKKNFDKYNKIQHSLCEMLIKLGNKFYLTSAYDKRGRCYYRAYYVSPQGNDYSKALVEFNNGEKL